jgi:hypothetical protein
MADLYRWQKGIRSLPSLELRRTVGGYITAKWGSLVLIPDIFGGPPKEKCDVSLTYGQAFYVSIPLFSGTVLLRSYSRDRLEYEIYQPEIETMLLDAGVDEAAEAVPIPLICGTVAHMQPQRTADVSGKMTYYLPDFAGALGTDWHFYDDGVLIDDSWADNGNGTISRSVNIVGTLTASGTGTMTDIGDLFAYAATRLSVELVSPHDADIPIDHCFTSNEYVTDVLGKVSWYAGYQYYFGKDYESGDRTMTLIAADEQNGESEVEKTDFQYVNYSWPNRVKILTANVTTYTASDEETETLTLYGASSVAGREETLSDVYSENATRVQTQAAWHLAYLEKPLVEIRMPFLRMPQHGEKVTFTDTTKAGVIVTDGYFHIEDISLSPKDRIMTLKGRGTLTFGSTS